MSSTIATTPNAAPRPTPVFEVRMSSMRLVSITAKRISVSTRDVHQDLHRSEKVGRELDVETGNPEEAAEQRHRGVDDVLGERHDAARAKGEPGQNVE